MPTEQKHLDRERLTISRMIAIYCSDKHDGDIDDLCPTCQEFLDYAERRLQKCPYGVDKPTCANCPIHCYKPARRDQAREIMRSAGSRMLLRHPFLTIAHKIDGLRGARHARELTREERLRSREE